MSKLAIGVLQILIVALLSNYLRLLAGNMHFKHAFAVAFSLFLSFSAEPAILHLLTGKFQMTAL